MFKLPQSTLLTISGLIWLVGGAFMLPAGLKLLVLPIQTGELPLDYSFMSWLSAYTGGVQNTAFLLLALSLFVGYLKGQKVLAKSVHRIAARLAALPKPISILKMYSLGYFLLIGSMVAMGTLVKWLNVPGDVRGMVDVAIGCALIQGAFLTFRQAFRVSKGTTSAS